MAERIKAGQYRENLAEFIFRFARAGVNDPSIAVRLGITPAQVRGIRKEYDIPAGERRWLASSEPRDAAGGEP